MRIEGRGEDETPRKQEVKKLISSKQRKSRIPFLPFVDVILRHEWCLRVSEGAYVAWYAVVLSYPCAMGSSFATQECWEEFSFQHMWLDKIVSLDKELPKDTLLVSIFICKILSLPWFNYISLSQILCCPEWFWSRAHWLDRRQVKLSSISHWRDRSARVKKKGYLALRCQYIHSEIWDDKIQLFCCNKPLCFPSS